MNHFHRVLVNTVVANTATAFLWFGWTFWVYLETRSVLLNAIIAGSYMGLLSVGSLVFGVIVDRLRPHFRRPRYPMRTQWNLPLVKTPSGSGFVMVRLTGLESDNGHHG